MNRNLRPTGWGVLVVSLAALALSGCGRKGGLDLPPTAQSASTENAGQPPTPEANRPSLTNPFGSNAPPPAAQVNKRPFILDPLLGN